MRGRRAYIDTNVFVYVATGHPELCDACLKVPELILGGSGPGLVPVLFDCSACSPSSFTVS
ncbi:MAG: hypothetical protein QW753_07785 [Thermofilum sp.]